MLIKLPIILNDMIDIINFSLDRYNNKYIISPLSFYDSDKYEVLISNKEFCLNKFTIKFPLELEVINNKYLYCKLFFVIAVLNGFDCELNFFSNLLKKINQYSNNLQYVNIDFLNKDTEILIKKINLQIDIKKKFEDLNEMNLYIDNQLNCSLNLIYLILYKFYNYNIKDFKNNNLNLHIPKKIIASFNLIKNYAIEFKGSEKISIFEHIDNLKNNNIIEDKIKENCSYFFKLKDSKVIKMLVKYKDGDDIVLHNNRILNVNNCEVYKYNPEFVNQLNFDYFMKEVLKYNLYFKKLIAPKIFKTNDTDIVNIIKFIYSDNSNYILLSSLRNLDFTFNNLKLEHYNMKGENLELKVLQDGYHSNEYMLYLSEKYKNDIEKKHEVLKILFDKYTFPLSFNKKKLNLNFEMIMYFSILNYNDFIKVSEPDKITLTQEILETIPVKLKNLYFNLLKTYYQLLNNSLENITYNFKYYQDYIYIYVIKNIIQENSILTKLFKNNNLYSKLIDVYSKNYILSQLIEDITWSNLSDKLNHLNYIYKNKDLIFYQQKLNRNLFTDNIDYKIKGIILDKMSMYKYLKKEKDFIKWTVFIKDYISDIYEKEISISNEDLIELGKLLFKLHNLENQNLKDPKYIDLLNFSKMNKKLILINNRINLMIKEKFFGIKCQLNLGYFAKHLNQNNYDKIEFEEDNEVTSIKLELKKITKKYFKYKGKYMKSKSLSSTEKIET